MAHLEDRPTPARRVLIVEPVMHVHSVVHFRAALGSHGFEDAHFTIITTAANDRDRERLAEFSRTNPRAEVRLLDVAIGPIRNRREAWRENGRVLHAVERVLRDERFDLIVYTLIDNVLAHFAAPGARVKLRGHFRHGVRGLAMRHHGLRPGSAGSWKMRLRDAIDRWTVGRAFRLGGLKRIALLDHRAADRGAQLFGAERCVRGVDPIDHLTADREASRAALGLAPNEFALLMFGAVSDRKGIVESLEIISASDLPLDRLALIVAGPVAPGFEKQIEAAVAAASARCRVIFRPGFVPEADVPSYFAAADCVVCVYKNFTASSGVLIHGASFGKPALVCAGGVMQDAVELYDFGKVASFDDPRGFVAALRGFIEMDAAAREALAARARKYAEAMDARRYMAQFL